MAERKVWTPAETEGEPEVELGTIEDRARRMGWVPREEFRGAPERWVDAETFVKNAETQLPYLKGTLAVMERKMAEQEALLKQQNEAIAAMKQDFSQFVDFTRKAEERAYAKALKELKEKQRQAVEEQDLAAFDKVSQEIDELLASHPAVTGKAVELPPVPPQLVPGRPAWFDPAELERWKSENPWYHQNPKLAAYAHQVDLWVNETAPAHWTHRQRLERVTELVKQEFPEYFGEARPKGMQAVEGAEYGSRPSAGAKRRKTYEDLPPEAKAMCDRFCGKDGSGKTGTIPGYTREDYVRDFFMGEE